MLSHRLFLVALTALIAAKAACLLSPIHFVQSVGLSLERSRFLSPNNNDHIDLISNKKKFRFDRLLMRRGNASQSKQLKKRATLGGVDVTVTNVLIAINIAVFLIVKKYPYLAQKYMKVDRLIARGQTYRLFSSVFLHQALYHVGANSYSLYNLGQMAEKTFGSARFLSTYLFAGILANVATYAFKSSPASLGASGCTFGIIGAFATYYYRNRLIFGKAQSDAGMYHMRGFR
jgi:membrane associated rhomboid family serine protease